MVGAWFSNGPYYSAIEAHKAADKIGECRKAWVAKEVPTWAKLNKEFSALNPGGAWLGKWIKIDESYSTETEGLVVHLQTGKLIHWTRTVNGVLNT
jgi:hypothetical protein